MTGDRGFLWLCLGEYHGPANIKAFLRYALERQRREREDMLWKSYVADGLMAISENTNRFAGGSVMKKRFIEIIHPQPEVKETGAQIAARVIAGAGLKIKRKEETKSESV